MNRPESPDTQSRRARHSSLSSLQPIDSSPFSRASSPWLVWGSILLMWLSSMLPWRLWSFAPDLLMLVLAFWAVHEPRRVPMSLAFLLGILVDVHDGSLLGEHALSYVLVVYGALVLRRRMLHFGMWTHVLHMLPVMLLAQLVVRVLHAWLMGEWSGWDWAGAVLLTAALWPLADSVLFLPQRRHDETDSGSP
ncbi:rod shape-determining protein MreD [Alcaligenes sp. WGS1538]|uniref:rod shape-determining protein MreD n=1 Tax=Alcaligenes sp. WGS1538 TaxID=3366811 RepID=UPI00372D3CEB